MKKPDPLGIQGLGSIVDLGAVNWITGPSSTAAMAKTRVARASDAVVNLGKTTWEVEIPRSVSRALNEPHLIAPISEDVVKAIRASGHQELGTGSEPFSFVIELPRDLLTHVKQATQQPDDDDESTIDRIYTDIPKLFHTQSTLHLVALSDSDARGGTDDDGDTIDRIFEERA